MAHSAAMHRAGPDADGPRLAAVSEPRLMTIESVTYGSTVICSSFTNASATHWNQAACSPRKRPTATPAPRPMRILLVNDIARFCQP